MLYKVGRVMQLVALFGILPAAIAGQALEHLSQGQMFLWTGVGIVVFLLGWLTQQASGKSE